MIIEYVILIVNTILSLKTGPLSCCCCYYYHYYYYYLIFRFILSFLQFFTVFLRKTFGREKVVII